MPTLVIVESPTKAKTISKYLPDNYQVEACMGHVRDLPGSASEVPAAFKKKPWAKDLGINVEENFEPLYVVPSAKKKVVSALKDALKAADSLIIATDEDREGESIGWHLTQVLKPKVPVRRMVFHEITRAAIESALENNRDIDENLVKAQEARRILDRLVGYTVSPILWMKIAPGLSAGRVQSVAVRLLVERERERRAFRSGSFWEIKAHLKRNEAPFTATLTHLDGQRIAIGRDFDETTGKLKSKSKVLLLTEDAAKANAERLLKVPWKVASVDRKPRKVQPYAPFTTSTLQQEGNRKLGLSSGDTMRIAQRLYEQGYITYMRTDSVNLSAEAIELARTCVKKLYGAEYLHSKARQYTTKSKGAQEAHEAIRPSGETMRTAKELSLVGKERDLYELIWKRTIATQMADSQQELISVTIHADNAVGRASGKRIQFPGFLRAYVEGSDDPNAALEDREVPIPDLQEGETVDVSKLVPQGKETRPPSRFTEATLVETLEKEGIGRPSTYATIIKTILDRDYARKIGNALVPTFTAFGVTQLMENNFQMFVDVGFTASMEEKLDAVASGQVQWLPYLKSFWSGDKGLQNLVSDGKENINPRMACTLTGFDDLKCNVRIGRFGPYLELTAEPDGEPVRVSIPSPLAPADLSAQEAHTLLQQKTDGPTSICTDPKTGEPVFVLVGRYGPYIQLGEAKPKSKEKPRRVSLPKGLTPEEITEEIALSLLSLPRTLGSHPTSGEPIVAAIGRYGPYVAHQKDFRSLTRTDDVLKVTLERALELLAQEKKSHSRASTQLRDLGKHPTDSEPVVVMSGRYGPYVKHGSINATIPKDKDPNDITLEQAVEMIAAKAANPTKKRGRRRKK